MKIEKTIKLFINGQFARSESGRTYPVNDNYARVCQASKKDFRNCVDAAKSGEKSWSSKSAYNRSQIMYRMAEMCEGKRDQFVSLFKTTLSASDEKANEMVDEGIASFVYYAGFCDKYSQTIGSVNPVSGPFHNFTTPESVGVVALLDSDEFNFGATVDRICSILVGGNSIIALLGPTLPAVLAPLSEVFATSDLPAGVVNLLTGHLEELAEVIASHREVRSISYQNESKKVYETVREKSVDNMKRIVPAHKELKSLENILSFVEYKTVWHPIGV